MVATPKSVEPLDVVVVAGGAGRRLGRDKALLMHADRRQVDHVVDAVVGLGGRIVLARGDRPLDVPGTVEVGDRPGLVGPLAGLVAGLEVASTPLVAVVAVDLVAPHAGLLTALATHVREHGLPGAMPVAGDRVQPLHAVVRRDLHADLAAATSPRLVTVLEGAGVVGVPESRWRTWTPTARPDHDLDTPDDLVGLPVGTP